MEYEHTQSRPQLGALLVLAGIAALGVALWQSDAVWFATSAFLVLLGILGFALSSLTTTVSTGAVVVGFRWGWPRRDIPRAQILRAEPVRNSWLSGWGLRWIPGGSMYNVWGLDAVALTIDGARDFRIGTDDPTGLAAAIDSSAGTSASER